LKFPVSQNGRKKTFMMKGFANSLSTTVTSIRDREKQQREASRIP